MSTAITGVVTKGVVVPNSPLPEGAHVEIHLQPGLPQVLEGAIPPRTPGELRKMPRELRQAILATAAKLAEQEYREDKELTGFAAFREEKFDDDERDSH